MPKEKNIRELGSEFPFFDRAAVSRDYVDREYLDLHLQKLEAKVDTVTERIDQANKRIDTIRSERTRNMTVMVPTAVATLGGFATAFFWLLDKIWEMKLP